MRSFRSASVIAPVVAVQAPVTTADVSCRLMEVDYAGIEAVLTGYNLRHISLDGAKAYIRLAKLGVHAAVTALAINKPADLSWPDDELGEYLKEIKESHPVEYDRSKRTVHGSNYGLTPFGAVEQFPSAYPTLKHAQQFFQFYYALAPALPVFHADVRKQAKAVGFLGGPTAPSKAPTRWDHPFGYRHWFWDVLSYQPTDEVTARKWLKDHNRRERITYLHGRPFKIIWGGDSKRVIAFYPQSTAAGVLKRAELRLFHPDSPDYIGDAYFGRTPLLGPIHDALFLHVPNRIYDRVLAIVTRVMQDEIPQLPLPVEWKMGNFLRIGVEAKGGLNWSKSSMKKLAIDPITFGQETLDDPPLLPREDADSEEWDALGRAVA